MVSSVSRIWPSRRTCSTSSASSVDTSRWPRTRPKARAGAEALTTSSSSSTTTALLRSTDSTVAMPAGSAGSSWPADVASCCRWLTYQARTAPPATTAPVSAARNACVVGLTQESYASGHLAFAVRRRAHGVFTGRSPVGPVRTPCPPTVGVMREAFHEQLDSIFSDLAEICQEVETSVRLATQALLNGDAEVA